MSDLSKKGICVESVGKEALENDKVLSELFEGILSKKDTIRYNSFKVLLLISEENPEVLYPKWDFFVGLIDSGNAYPRLIAVRIIANLTRADSRDKFNKIFDKYYDLFNDSVIVAGHLAANSGKIAKAKPELQTRVTNELLNKIRPNKNIRI